MKLLIINLEPLKGNLRLASQLRRGDDVPQKAARFFCMVANDTYFHQPRAWGSSVTQFCLLIEEHLETSQDWKGPANLSLLPEIIWDRTRILISNHTATTNGG